MAGSGYRVACCQPAGNVGTVGALDMGDCSADLASLIPVRAFAIQPGSGVAMRWPLTAAFLPGYAASMLVVRFDRYLAALVIAAALLGGADSSCAVAQTAKPAPEPKAQDAPQAAPAPKSKKLQRGSSLPKTPAEREKTLSDLYALLATAEDEEAAKAISDAIERVWLHSGSATVDVLMERSIKAM